MKKGKVIRRKNDFVRNASEYEIEKYVNDLERDNNEYKKQIIEMEKYFSNRIQQITYENKKETNKLILSEKIALEKYCNLLISNQNLKNLLKISEFKCKFYKDKFKE